MKRLFILFLSVNVYSQSSGLSKDQIQNQIREQDSILLINPNAFDFYLRGVNQSELENFPLAIDDLSTSIELDNTKKESYYFRAVCYERLKKYKKAIADYSSALQIDSNYSEALSRRAYCKGLLNDYNGSIEDYNSLISVKPTSLSFNNRGLAYYNLNQSIKAIPDFDKAIELDKSNIDAIQNRALAKAAVGDKTAINDFNKVIELQPKNAKAYYNRAIHVINYKLKGDFCTDLKKSLALGYTDAQQIINELCK